MWAGMNANAKGKATKHDLLESYVNGATNYIIFNNALTADDNTDIYNGGVQGTIPSSWLIPSTIQISNGSALYNGANSTAKLGKSGAPGSISIALKDNSHVFTKIKLEVVRFGSDNGKVSISGLEGTLTPTVETGLLDISASKLSEITIATSEKRVYISYIYFEEEANVDTLDSTISSTGTLQKAAYIEGQSFDPTGLTFSVTYNGGSNSKNIAYNSISWSPDPLTTGTTQVTGTYTEGLQSATIVISGLTVAAYTQHNLGQVGKSVADYAGTYYFACVKEGANRIWNPKDDPAATLTSKEVTINNNVIASTVLLDDCLVTIIKSDDGYFLKNSTGAYIGPATANINNEAVNASLFSDAVLHTITGVDAEGVVTISAEHTSGVTVYLRFNPTSGQYKARYYTSNTKVSGITLFKQDAAPVKSLKQDVDTFVNTYLHMTDYTENLGYCKDSEHHYYADAKDAFLDLSAEEVSYFLANYDDAKARLVDWAKANGETFNTTNGTFGLVRPYNVFNTSENSSVIYIVLATCVTLIAISGAAILVKKKQK